MIATAENVALHRFQHSDGMLRRLLEHAAVGIAMAGMDGRIVYANRAMADMLGLDPDAIAGSHVSEAIVPAEKVAGLRYDLPSDYEFRVRRSDGRAFWASVSVSHVESETTSAPTHMIIHVSDIDARKQAQLATTEAELRWKFALDGAGQGVWDHDLVNGTCFYSSAWRRMRGFSDDEFIDPSAESWLSRVHPEDRKRLAEETTRQDAGEIPENVFEYRERHRDGHWIWILSRGRPVAWNPDGSVARTLGTDTDITSIKLAHETAEQERERFRTTLQSLSDAVLSCGIDGRIEFANPAAAMLLLGHGDGTLVGRQAKQVIHSDAVLSAVEACICLPSHVATSADADLDVEGHELRHVRYSVSPVMDSRSELKSIAVVLQDVTERRRGEVALRHAASHDGLTGLANRKEFEIRLMTEIERVAKGQGEASLCFVDLDRFKSVNDTHGHMAGDMLLREVAARMHSCCRKDDFLARIGGDEFAVVLRGSVEQTDELARRFVKAVSEIGFSWEGSPQDVGASVGVTSIKDSTPAGLMNAADKACYAAKHAGRNRMIRL